jgi:hypothetical protein
VAGALGAGTREKLISPLERTQQSIEFVADGLLRGDSASRGEFNSKQFSVAMLTPNEGRKLENRNPLNGGDTAFVPLTHIPLELATPYFEAKIDAEKASAEASRRPPPPPGPTPDQVQQQKQREADHAAELAAARKIAQDAEEAKDLAVHERGQVAAELAKSQTAYEALVAARASERADFTGQIETLRSDLVTAQSLRDQTLAAKDVAEAARAALAVDLTRVQLLLETEQRDRIAERAEAVRHAGDLTTQIEALSLDVTVAQRDREAADALTQQVRKDLEQMTAQATSLGTDLITAQREFKDVFERNQVVEIDYEHVCQEKQALTTRAETTDAIVTELRTQLTEAMAAVAAGEMARAAAMADHDRVVSGVRAELAQVSETSVRVEGELRRSDEIAQAVIVELRTQVATLTAEGSTLTTALAEAKEQIGRAETVAAEAVRKLDAAETLATSHALAAKTLADQQVATKQALRGVLVDAVGLLVAKETHRARQSAGSPEKLAKWAEAFYPMHDDFCRTALRPAVRAWLVASGTDLTADQVLDRVVPSCIAESTRSLRGLVAETDSESLAPALERVLRRWDTERPEAIADRIMKESA